MLENESVLKIFCFESDLLQSTYLCNHNLTVQFWVLHDQFSQGLVFRGQRFAMSAPWSVKLD
jgi:hypothetical protein